MRDDLTELFRSAVDHCRAGRLQEAERIYRRILALQPGHPKALQLLGVTAHQAQDFTAAVNWLEQAAAAMPDDAATHFNLGNALCAQRRLDAAEAALQKAIDLKPDLAEAYSTLASIRKDQGRVAEAETLLRRAITLRPDNPVALNNLGNLLMHQGRTSEAESCFRRAIETRSDYAEAYYNLGNLLYEQGSIDAAESLFRNALRYKPGLPQSYVNLGNLLEQQGRPEEAETVLRRAVELQPGYPQAHNNLGNVLTGLGRAAEAETSLRRAIALRPDYAEALYNLGSLLRYQGRLAEAETLLHRSIELNPDNPEAHNNLGTVLKDQGRLDEAQAALQRALALQQDYTKAHSNLVFYMHYRAGVTPQDLEQAHRRWNNVQASKFNTHRHAFENTRQPQRRLRVGYVSPDFREHSVAYFFAPLLANHDPNEVETFLYSGTAVFDGMTQRLQGLAAHWRDVNRISDARLAEQICADRIDVLVDLAGHTADNRLLVFARRPAPVQFTYLGYPGITGLSAIDYRITDQWVDPHGSSGRRDGEEPVRLAGGFLCYEIPEDAPPPGAAPVTASGCVTFGSFNDRAKITGRVLDAWCSILGDTPGSRLLLKCRSFHDEEVRRSCLAVFEAHDIDPGRVRMLGPVPGRANHLAVYHQVDIALDTFPYNGATTTCEALSMGVPVITLAGDTHASRVGYSLLHNLDLSSLITDSVDDYVSTACTLARDPAAISAFRGSLRDRLRKSPLCNGRRLARAMEHAFRSGWRRWCDQPED